MSTATELLEQAAATQKERGKQYDKGGQQERSMARVVNAFNAIYGTNLTEYQGWRFMEILKIVRSSNAPHEDSCLDAVSYSALAGECRTQSVATGDSITAGVHLLYAKIAGTDITGAGYYEVMDAAGDMMYAHIKTKGSLTRGQVLRAVRDNGYDFPDNTDVIFVSN